MSRTPLGAPTLIGCGPTDSAPPSPAAIGFKAHNLARMARIGLPVPPAFVIDTHWCTMPERLTRDVWQPALAELERVTRLCYGDPRRPLLLSVRSGAAVSMPGMMSTLLNVGLTDTTLPGMLRLTGNPRLAWDAYRRLIAGYGETVLGLDAAAFEADMAAVAGGRAERELDFAELRSLAGRHLATVQRLHGRPFPQDPIAQLEGAVAAVFASWHGDKARAWRRMHEIDDAIGTAVTVQRMVFGNGGGLSGAGVGFTRHPSTGEPEPWIDFLFESQGEDVVSGRRSAPGPDALASVAPRVWDELLQATHRLEAEFGDMQDFEFTVEDARLYLLQTRAGKRTPQAAARIALDLLDAGTIDRAEALRRTAGLDERSLAQTRVVADEGSPATAIARAASACTGVASGEIAFDQAGVRERTARGAAAILLRPDAETRDIEALDSAAGLLTMRGARTSHAAVVARQLGKVCLVGCDALQIDLAARTARIGDQSYREGDVLTLDGNTGCVYAGAVRTATEVPQDLLRRLESLRDASDASASA